MLFIYKLPSLKFETVIFVLKLGNQRACYCIMVTKYFHFDTIFLMNNNPLWLFVYKKIKAHTECLHNAFKVTLIQITQKL